jgi:hypothetical protein
VKQGRNLVWRGDCRGLERRCTDFESRADDQIHEGFVETIEEDEKAQDRQEGGEHDTAQDGELREFF